MSPEPIPANEPNDPLDPDQIIYLIGFSPSATEATRRRIGESLPMVHSVSQRNIECWYVPVDRSLFEGESGEKNLADLDWLGPKVLAHQMAVETLSGELPFFPAHFGTLFSCLDKLAALTLANWRALTEYFAGDALNVEWGVKCWVNWPRAVESFQEAHPAPPETAGAGLNYLMKKKMIRDRDQAVREWIDRIVLDVRNSFDEIAIRHRSLPAKAAARDGDWECLDNWALLVDPGDSGRVETWIRDKHPELMVDSAMLRLHVTGPWPLYSFLPCLTEASVESSVESSAASVLSA